MVIYELFNRLSFVESWRLIHKLYSLRKTKRNCITTLRKNIKSIVRTYKWLNATQQMLNYQIEN